MTHMTVGELPEVEDALDEVQDALDEIRPRHPRAVQILEGLVAPYRAAHESDWISTGQAAAIVGVTPQTIRNWVDSGWVDSRRRSPFGRRLVSTAALRDVARFRSAREAQANRHHISEEEAAEALQARRRTDAAAEVGVRR